MKAQRMMHEFLAVERHNILTLCARKSQELASEKGVSEELMGSLSNFYDQLTTSLHDESNQRLPIGAKVTHTANHSDAAKRRGAESLKLGYTVSQVIHGYGVICQAITEHAAKNSEDIATTEFHRLNMHLDNAIAWAVTEFDYKKEEATQRNELQRLGFLAHEMRNALNTATMAYRMIKQGVVGAGGSTSQLLDDAHKRLRDIIERSLSEVRLRSNPTIELENLPLLPLMSEVEVSSSFEAIARAVEVRVSVPANLEVNADRHLLGSALTNLLQNAIKFTSRGSTVWVSAKVRGDQVLIEVEDQCGGLHKDKIEELFKPFVQKGGDLSGIGLGLAIARRAVELNKGKLSARNVPGKGCVFSIELPRA